MMLRQNCSKVLEFLFGKLHDTRAMEPQAMSYRCSSPPLSSPPRRSRVRRYKSKRKSKYRKTQIAYIDCPSGRWHRRPRGQNKFELYEPPGRTRSVAKQRAPQSRGTGTTGAKVVSACSRLKEHKKLLRAPTTRQEQPAGDMAPAQVAAYPM